MKLITWNCQGAFRNKAQEILCYKPDILVLPESENPDKFNYGKEHPRANSFYWHGDSPYKGIGIYSYSEYKLEILSEFNPLFRYVIPMRVTGYGHSFILFAIWAMDSPEDHDARYIGQVWRAIHHYIELLDSPVIIAGDFNSNKIWDLPKRIGNHSHVVDKLAERNIHSIYHQHFKIEQGKESHPTFFLQRNKIKPYHIDYCFASEDLANKVQRIEIGTYENWIRHSDHTPVIIDFAF